MSAYLPADVLPRSTSTPVIAGQYASVQGVGIAPIVLLGIGAMSLIGGAGFLAGRGTATAQPPTFGSAVGTQVGSVLKWALVAGVGYYLVTGKVPKLKR